MVGAGSPVRCQGADRMRPRCDYSERTCLRCGLIWMDEAHLDRKASPVMCLNLEFASDPAYPYRQPDTESLSCPPLDYALSFSILKSMPWPMVREGFLLL